MSERARTVFFGTGAFAVPVLAGLAEHAAVDLIGVVTAPARRGSRGRMTEPPVAEWASEHGLPMLRPERLRSPEAVDEIVALAPDLIVLADYGQIVPARLIDLPRFGALNLHPSLLPRHRGATPVNATILAGDREAGVSLMRMDAGLDTGPIVAQWRTTLRGDETAPELEAELARQAAALLGRTLDGWLAGEIHAASQTEAEATLTRPLRREDGRLDAGRSAVELERQVRGLQPWPGSFVDTPAGRVVVWRAHVDEAAELPPGRLARGDGGGLELGTAGAVLALDEVQPAGGRRMSGAELLRGRPALNGQQIVSPAEEGS